MISSPLALTRFIRFLTHGCFVGYWLLVFSTPAWWRSGPFAWWPVVVIRDVAGPPVQVGALNFLPIVIGLGWVLEKVLSKKRPFFTLPASPITWPLLALTSWSLLRLIPNSPQVVLPLAGAIGLSWLGYLYLMEKRPSFTFPLCFTILLQSGVALGQFFKQQHIGLTLLGEVTLFLDQPGLTMLYARDTQWLRAYGLTVSPNLLGTTLVICLLILLPIYHQLSGWQWGVMGLVFAIGLMGLFVSFSRSAWIAWGVGVVSYYIFARPKPRIHLLLPVLPCLVLLFAYHDLAFSRVANLETPLEKRSIEQRQLDYNVALQMIQQNWLVGVGLGNYEASADKIQGLTGSVKVHNIPLLVTAELGIIGLVCWLWLGVTPFWHTYQKAKQAATSPFFAPALSLWIAMLVMNQFDKIVWFGRNWQPVLLLTLILATVSQSLTTTHTHQNKQ